MKHFPITVICDNIRSLYNVGAIFRTSDAANIEKLYLCGISGYPKDDPNWFQTLRIEKTALGATKTVPWEYRKSAKLLIKALKKKRTKIYVLENTPNATRYTNCDYQFPCALVLGHERNGVDDEIIKLADKVIKIPMYGTKTSLNVEVAYSVAVYELLKHF